MKVSPDGGDPGDLCVPFDDDTSPKTAYREQATGRVHGEYVCLYLINNVPGGLLFLPGYPPIM